MWTPCSTLQCEGQTAVQSGSWHYFAKLLALGSLVPDLPCKVDLKTAIIYNEPGEAFAPLASAAPPLGCLRHSNDSRNEEQQCLTRCEKCCKHCHNMYALQKFGEQKRGGGQETLQANSMQI